MTTIRLTMAQALTRYLAAQTSEVDGCEVPLFAGVFAIFGHGNVAGLGEALYDARERLPSGCRRFAPTTSRRWAWQRSPLLRRAGAIA
jgi:TPP-dependent trihydroxycyclohexane-1,2-dione (THcHDO) dehydratase